MIVTIDHLTYTTDNKESAKKFFLDLGYKIKFEEVDKTNLKIKRCLSNFWSPLHDLVFFEVDNGIQVEIVFQKKISKKTGYLIPIIDSLSTNLFIKKSFVKIGGYTLTKVEVPELEAQMYLSNESNRPVITQVVMETVNIGMSKGFWSSLGFNLKIEKLDYVKFEFKSLTKNGFVFYLHLIEIKSRRKLHKIDEGGFNSLVMVSTSIKSDRIKLRKQGFSVTDIERKLINSKNISIFFVTSPSGELVEIIGVD